MKKIFLLCILTIPHVFAQKVSNLTYSKAEKVGISSERLGRIDAMIKEAIETEQIPGAVALIARNGQIIHHKAYGNASPGLPLKENSIFRIASQTKAITSTGIMMLWEEGKFKLDDPISKYIPEFKEMGVIDTFNDADSSFTTTPAKTQITIRHLLTHTSGIGYGVIDIEKYRKMYQKAGIIDIFTAEPVLLEDNIKRLAKMPLHFNPGENYKYSEGLDVLGYLIEKISGQPLDVFFKERIFKPLGMDDTYFYLPQDKANRLVSVQTKKDDKWSILTEFPYYDPLYPVKGAKTFFSGGAGLSSTALDYAKFLQMYLNNGEYNGKRLLSRTTVRSIMANQIGDIWAGRNDHHGLAFSVINKKGEDAGGSGSEGTFSWGGYFNTQYFADPKDQIIGIIMKQTLNIKGDETGWKFKQMVFQTLND
jgi:CubicO group peptidase (beta-lactamase class C family)